MSEEPVSLRYDPPSAGAYHIGKGSMVMYIEKKPLWLHRWFCRLLLGWEWKDNDHL